MNENNAWTSPDGRSYNQDDQSQSQAHGSDASGETPGLGQPESSGNPEFSSASNPGAPSSEGAPIPGQPEASANSPAGREALGDTPKNQDDQSGLSQGNQSGTGYAVQSGSDQGSQAGAGQGELTESGQGGLTESGQGGQTGSAQDNQASQSRPSGPSNLSQPNPNSQPNLNRSAQYGANQFWGQPGFSDPMAGTKPLQSSVTWAQPAEKTKRRGPGWLATIGIAVAASLVTGGGFYLASEALPGRAESANSTLFSPEDKGVTTPAPVANSTSQNPDWEAVANAVRPAVVAIMVSTGSSGDEGSGSIIDSDGHILTNNHVVAGAAGGNGQITVELADGRLYKAEIVGRDVLTDLAVIKMENPPKDLTVVALGDSSKLQVGESVVAIGNPLGLSSTVTTGIVSALDRPVRVDAVQGGNQNNRSDQLFDLRDLFGNNLGGESGNGAGSGNAPVVNDKVTTNAIQVDAAVNPGNSGGPLFDAKGRVIGVTSSIASLSSGSGLGGGQAGSIGLGFAIPVNQAKMIATQLIEHGEAVHAALGITVSEDIATVKDVSRLGAKVQEMVPRGAAEKAGVKVGDIIVGLDGKPVKGSESLVGWVRQHAVGDTVELEIVRGDKEMKVSVTLQAQ